MIHPDKINDIIAAKNAEIDKLKVALERIAKFERKQPNLTGSDAIDCYMIARRALGVRP